MGLTANGAKATLSLATSPKIPANLQADVRSISAVGEQYVDLRPKTDSPPYLRNGSVIPMRDTTIPQAVGPLLEQVNALISSIPKNKLSQLLDESFQSFNGEAYDLGSLFDSSARISADANSVADRTRTLTEDTVPLLDSQARTTDSVRTWARSLAGISDVLVTDDSRVRTLLQNGPEAANEASRLFEQIKPTLPVLLANLTTIGQIGVTYHPGLEQLLVLLPTAVAIEQAAGPTNHPEGFAQGDFALTIDDPPICTVGFLPPSQWRSPADTSDIDTPDDMYCKLPQDSPLSVRGARNYPCMDKPGKRAPTVEICKSDKPYMPLAMRQHTLGPTPSIPTCSRRAFRPTTGSPPATGSTPRLRAHRCHQERSLGEHLQGRGVRLRHQARWERLHRRSRHRDRRRRSSHRSPVRFHPLRHLTSPRRVSRPAISLAATYDSAARQCQRRAAASGAECIRHDQGISATSGDRKV
ncbi:mce family protein [Mycobacterium xenopi 3993]|nr:mce family protein [Mycobacterium xenopi 3993]